MFEITWQGNVQNTQHIQTIALSFLFLIMRMMYVAQPLLIEFGCNQV